MEGIRVPNALKALSPYSILITLMMINGVFGGSYYESFDRRLDHRRTAFVPSSSVLTKKISLRCDHHHKSEKSEPVMMMVVTNDKSIFLDSLDKTDSLNLATKLRTSLLHNMIDNKVNVASNKWKEGEEDSSSSSSKSLQKPGLQETFNLVSEGNWKVIYAPHMTTIAGLFGGKFDVQYIMHENEKMESHAKYDFPLIGTGFLSVSGTYSSVDENASRVDFDKAWVKPLLFSNEKDDNKEKPYKSLDDVPEGPIKAIINAVGKSFFFEQVSVFPISFLDSNMIVFDFPLLGTRICALKQD